MKSVQLITMFFLFIVSCLIQAKENAEQFYKDQNWMIMKVSKDVDPFTKKGGFSHCYITDKQSEFNIYISSDPDNDSVFFNYRPSKFSNIIQQHYKDIGRSEEFLSKASEGDYGSAGVYSHIKLTHSSTQGVIYTQNIRYTQENTPEKYPFRFKHIDTLFPDEKGIQYGLEPLCDLFVGPSGEPEISHCNSIQFQLSKKVIKKIESEAKTLRHDNYILRMTTFSPIFAEKSYTYYPSHYVENKSYDFSINIFGLTSNLNNFLNCK